MLSLIEKFMNSGAHGKLLAGCRRINWLSFRNATIESIGSSTRIEGSKLDDKEVEI